MASPSEFKPVIVGFLCNWCCYGGADLCGVSRFQYPPYLRVIRLMCSGRVDLEFIFRAFAKKADGVFIGGCHLNDCHYNPEGNYDALGNSMVANASLERWRNPERLRLEWSSAGEAPLRRGHERVLGQDQEPGPPGVVRGQEITELQAGAAGGHRPGALHQAGRARAIQGAGKEGRELPQALRQRRDSTSCPGTGSRQAGHGPHHGLCAA
jgi:coenzyme F420-reducing hydrogenase delta subunit